MAWVDVSTGDVELQRFELELICSVMEQILPQEILISEEMHGDTKILQLLEEWIEKITVVSSVRFNSTNNLKRLCEFYSVNTMDAFGNFSKSEMIALGALIEYIDITQKGLLPPLKRPRQIKQESVMFVDVATRRNLELTHTLSGERKGSLLDVLDKTNTASGSRMLSSRLSCPLTSIEEINHRLNQVEVMLDANIIRSDISELFKITSDIERPFSRISLGRGGPRDLASICSFLSSVPKLKQLLTELKNNEKYKKKGDLFGYEINNLGDYETIADIMVRALSNDLPVFVRDGGFIRSGFSDELDRLKQLSKSSYKQVLKLQSQYISETGVQSLKIKNNNLLGYFIEVPSKHGEIFLKNDDNRIKKNLFVHRQTMANAYRFTTQDLIQLEQEIKSAGEKSLEVELDIFDDIVDKLVNLSRDILATSEVVARIDVTISLAQVALDRKYSRPIITPDCNFEVEMGRHPVVENALLDLGEGDFIPNSCQLTNSVLEGPGRLWLLTGPNMAGKSTFLRQNALIVL